MDFTEEIAIRIEEKVKEDDKETDYQPEESSIVNWGDTLGIYFREISKIAVLTYKEELNLCKTISIGRAAKSKLNAQSRTSKNIEELYQLINEGQCAYNKLIHHNVKLVVTIAKKHRRSNVPFGDLIQEGNLALFRTANKFDPSRGFRFTTYASNWIREFISRYIDENQNAISSTVYAQDQFREINRTEDELRQTLRKNPSKKEIADALEISCDQLKSRFSAGVGAISLHTSTEEDSSDLEDLIPDENLEDEDTTLLFEKIRNTLALAMDSLGEEVLSRRNREILILRYTPVTPGGKVLSLEEIGKKYNLSRETVRLIDTKALKALREGPYSELLQNLLGEL